MPAGIAQLTKVKNEIEVFFLVKLSAFIAFAPYQKRATVARLALLTKHSYLWSRSSSTCHWRQALGNSL